MHANVVDHWSKKVPRVALRMVLVLIILASSACYFRGYADPLPPLVWTGGTYIDASPEFPASVDAFATATDTGFTVFGYCSDIGNECYSSFDADRTFTVTSPGSFLISGSELTSVSALECDPASCHASSYVSASFDGDIIIPFGDDVFEFSGVRSAHSPNFEVTLQFSDAQSDVVRLPLGNYALMEYYSLASYGSGDISMDYHLQDSIVPMPIPEPRGYVVFLGAAFAIMCGRKLGRDRIALRGERTGPKTLSN
jgi:hypothetical protein